MEFIWQLQRVIWRHKKRNKAGKIVSTQNGNLRITLEWISKQKF